MSSLFKPKAPRIPPPPPPPELIEFSNEIFGVTTKEIIGPDGKKKIIQTQTLSPEERQFRDQVAERGQAAFNEIARLSSFELASQNPAFQDTLQAFEDINQRALEASFETAAGAQEDILSRRGLSESTAAAESRAALGGQRAAAEQDVSSRTQLLAEDLRSQAINRNLGLLQTSQGIQQQNLQNALTGTQAGLGLQSQAFSADVNRGNQVFQQGVQQSQLNFQAQQSGLQNLGALASFAAVPFTGGFSLGGVQNTPGFNPFGNLTGGQQALQGLGFTSSQPSTAAGFQQLINRR